MAQLAEILTRRHLPALDGLRAVAVGLVIAYHAGAPVPGDLGVSLFFVLSGFLITWLLLAEHDRTGTISFRRFYWRRTFRIIPAYYAFLAASWAADTLLGDPWPQGLTWSGVGYLVNYYNAFTGTQAGTIAHTWSLAIEEQFYLLWPALFVVAARWGRRGITFSLIGAVALVCAWRSWLYLSGTASHVYAYNAFDTRFDQLAIGCLLAVVATAPLTGRLAAGLARWWWLPLVTAAAVAVSRVGIGERWHYSAGFTVDAALLAVLLVQLTMLAEHRAWRWLSWRWMTWLGAISYPLYLWHGWGLTAGHRAPGGPVVELATGIIVSVGLAAGSYYVIERPMLAVRDRLGNRPRRRLEHAVVARAGAVLLPEPRAHRRRRQGA